MPTATFPEIFNGLLFRSILRMCVQNLKFVALPIPEIIAVTQKIWAVPGYAYTPFLPKFLMGFCLDGPCECTCRIWSGFTHSWDNRGYSKNYGQSLHTSMLIFLQNVWWAFVQMDPMNIPAKFEVCSFTEITVIAVLGWGCEPPILGKRGPQVVGDGTVWKSIGEFL